MKRKLNAEGYERIKIGTYIRKWRSIKDIKQKELASALRLSEAAISNIENDLTDITLSQIEDISLTLDIPIEQLFTDPQEIISSYPLSAQNEQPSQQLKEKELLYTLIGTIQQKDDQMKEVINNVMLTMNKISGLKK